MVHRSLIWPRLFFQGSSLFNVVPEQFGLEGVKLLSVLYKRQLLFPRQSVLPLISTHAALTGKWALWVYGYWGERAFSASFTQYTHCTQNISSYCRKWEQSLVQLLGTLSSPGQKIVQINGTQELAQVVCWIGLIYSIETSVFEERVSATSSALPGSLTITKRRVCSLSKNMKIPPGE